MAMSDDGGSVAGHSRPLQTNNKIENKMYETKVVKLFKN